MDHDLIRMFHRFQGVPFMPWLPTAFLPVALPQTLGRRFAQTITGRRLATIATVLGKPTFQILNSSRQLFYLRKQIQDQIILLFVG